MIAAVVAVVLIIALVFWEISRPEHERGLLDERGGKDLADKPCAELEQSLNEQFTASGMRDDWDSSGGHTVTCNFTLAAGDGQWKSHVHYWVRHQPLLFGRDREKQMDGIYGSRMENDEAERDNRESSHWREIANLGEHAKTYLMWDDGNESTTRDVDVGDNRPFEFDQWLDTGKVSRVARVLFDNALVEVEIEAKLPVAPRPDGLIHESEHKPVVARNFTPPIEDVTRKALAPLG